MLKSYVAFDIETTGLNPQENEIIEIGALKVRDGKVADRFIEFIHPTVSIAPAITALTGITDEMVSGARPRCQVVSDFLDFCENDVLIGHNVSFDYSFMKCSAAADGSLCEYYHIENKSAHRAYHDALATAKLYQTLAHYFEEKDPKLFKPVQLTYRVKKPQPATPKQIAFLNNLIRKKRVKRDWDSDTITRSEASRMIDELLKG